MANNAPRIGWIGAGRMGLPMAELLLKAGHELSVWNRTAAKAEPLAQLGAKDRQERGRPRRPRHRVLDRLDRQGPGGGLLRGRRRGRRQGQAAGRSSSTAPPSASRSSAGIRKRLAAAGAQYIAAPVSGNARVIRGAQALRRRLGAGGGVPQGRAADQGVRAAAASPTSARASSRACARSPTTSCWASSSRT